MWPVVLVALAGCSFRPLYEAPADGAPPADAPEEDAALDAPASRFCADDPHLRLCFSFDQDPLPAALAGEGAVAVEAQLTNVERIPRGAGGAAQLGTSSTIWVPRTPEVAGIQAIEVWYRADADPETNGGRMGLVDSNVTPSNISLFAYRVDPAHQLRCGLGDAVVVWNATLPPGAWRYLACTCDAGNLRMYVDGIRVGDTPAACASGGALTANDGLTIGQNNNGGAVNANEWLVGAIDGVRLWDAPLTAPVICATAGLTSCE